MTATQGVDMKAEKQIDIYQSADGQTQIEVQLQGNTVWLSQAQRVDVFGRDQSVVSRHIRNALEEGEVSEKSNMQKMHKIPAGHRRAHGWPADMAKQALT